MNKADKIALARRVAARLNLSGSDAIEVYDVIVSFDSEDWDDVAWVEQFVRNSPGIMDLIRNGQPIAAIKVVREASQKACLLTTAKRAVDAVRYG